MKKKWLLSFLYFLPSYIAMAEQGPAKESSSAGPSEIKVALDIIFGAVAIVAALYLIVGLYRLKKYPGKLTRSDVALGTLLILLPGLLTQWFDIYMFILRCWRGICWGRSF